MDMCCILQVVFTLMTITLSAADPRTVILRADWLLHAGLNITANCGVGARGYTHGAIICVKVTAHCRGSSTDCSHRLRLVAANPLRVGKDAPHRTTRVELIHL